MHIRLILLTLFVFVASKGMGQELFENGKSLELTAIDSCDHSASSIVRIIHEKLSFDYSKGQVTQGENSIKIRLSFKVLVPYMHLKISNEVFYDLIVEVKDKRYRMIMNNFEVISQGIQKYDYYTLYDSSSKKARLVYKTETYNEQNRVKKYIHDALNNTKETNDW